MALKPAICTQCGGQIQVDDSKEAGVCPNCKTAFITEKVINQFVTQNNFAGATINVQGGASTENLKTLAYRELQKNNRLEALDYFTKLRERCPDDWEVEFYCNLLKKNNDINAGSGILIKGKIDNLVIDLKTLNSCLNLIEKLDNEDKIKQHEKLNGMIIKMMKSESAKRKGEGRELALTLLNHYVCSNPTEYDRFIIKVTERVESYWFLSYGTLSNTIHAIMHGDKKNPPRFSSDFFKFLDILDKAINKSDSNKDIKRAYINTLKRFYKTESERLVKEDKVTLIKKIKALSITEAELEDFKIFESEIKQNESVKMKKFLKNVIIVIAIIIAVIIGFSLMPKDVREGIIGLIVIIIIYFIYKQFKE